MSQKLPVNDFEWGEDTSQFNKDFIKIYNEENDEWYFLDVNAQYPETLHELHIGLPFLPDRMKIENLVANLYDKAECVIYIRILKETLNHELVLKVHRMIKFNEKLWSHLSTSILI